MNEITNIAQAMPQQSIAQTGISPQTTQSKMLLFPPGNSMMQPQQSNFLGLDTVITAIFAGISEMFKNIVSFVTGAKTSGTAGTSAAKPKETKEVAESGGGGIWSNLLDGGKDLLSTIGSWFGFGSDSSSKSTTKKGSGNWFTSLVDTGKDIWDAGKKVVSVVKKIF